MLNRTRGRGKSTIHWQTPLLLLSSLFIGSCLAIAHHTFYHSLHLSSVNGERFNFAGWRTSQQQLVSVAGVLFAFIVKASLVLCASVAYMQLFFRAIQTGEFQLKTLDRWFAALEDVRSLCCTATIYRYPVMTLIALTAWLLPLAAVFSPAALSVTYDLIQPSPVTLSRVPQPPFESLALSSFSRDSGPWETNVPVKMSGPSEELSRIANAVASGGTILPMRPPGSNASWQLAFEAPRLSCDNIQGQEYQRVRENIFNAYNASRAYNASIDPPAFTPGAFFGPKIDSGMFSYLAWLDWDGMRNPHGYIPSHLGPFVPDSSGNWGLSDQSYLKDMNTMGANLSIGVLPNANIVPTGNWTNLLLFNVSDPPHLWADWNKAANLMMDWYLQDATLLKCQMLNANYKVKFSFINQEQQVEIVSVSPSKAVPNVFNDLKFNMTDEGLVLFAEDNQWHMLGSTSEEMSRNAQRSLSYSSLWQSTLSVLLGASNNPYRMLSEATLNGTTYRTQVFSTILMDTIDMSALHKGILDPTEVTNMKSGAPVDYVASLLPLSEEQDQTRKPLKEAIEELFFNITVSIMSSPSLQYNSSSPYAPAPVNVTFAHYGNIYIYEPSKLWIPYGIALGISVLNVICGFWAMFDTGASFTADFSTIARIVKNANIDRDLREEVLPGKDPLEKGVGEARFGLRLRSDKPPRYEEVDVDVRVGINRR